MGFLPDIHTECETCKGTGYSPEAWDIRLNGHSLPELNDLTLAQVYDLFKDHQKIEALLRAALDVGLGYLLLHQPGFSMSGGEAQRMKIAKELCKKTKDYTLYILDEPTVGQHLEDVERLIGILQRLVDAGNTVIVVEHHPNVLAACDWLIELGPVGGPEGGLIVASETPEKVSLGKTPSAAYIKKVLEGNL